MRLGERLDEGRDGGVGGGGKNGIAWAVVNHLKCGLARDCRALRCGYSAQGYARRYYVLAHVVALGGGEGRDVRDESKLRFSGPFSSLRGPVSGGLVGGENKEVRSIFVGIKRKEASAPRVQTFQCTLTIKLPHTSSLPRALPSPTTTHDHPRARRTSRPAATATTRGAVPAVTLSGPTPGQGSPQQNFLPARHP